MGDEDNRAAHAMHLLENLHDFLGGFGIEVAGRLIGHDDVRVIDERPRNRDPLPLTTRQFIGLMARPVSKAHRL